MDVCYTEDFVMPKNHTLMDVQEMSYVEGGLAFSITLDRSVIIALAGVAVTAVIASACANVGITGLASQAIISGTAGILGSAITASFLKKQSYTFSLDLTYLGTDVNLMLFLATGCDGAFTLSLN